MDNNAIFVFTTDSSMSILSPKKINSSNQLNDFRLLICMFQDYFSAKYRGISNWSLFILIFGILYFISPIDLIPDFMIPFIGYIDDAIVLGFVYRQLMKEVKKYKLWRTINIE